MVNDSLFKVETIDSVIVDISTSGLVIDPDFEDFYVEDPRLKSVPVVSDIGSVVQIPTTGLFLNDAEEVESPSFEKTEYEFGVDIRDNTRFIIKLVEKLKFDSSRADYKEKNTYKRAFKRFVGNLGTNFPKQNAYRLKKLYSVNSLLNLTIDGIHRAVDNYVARAGYESLYNLNSMLVDFMADTIRNMDEIQANIVRAENVKFLKNPLVKYVFIASAVSLYIENRYMSKDNDVLPEKPISPEPDLGVFSPEFMRKREAVQ